MGNVKPTRDMELGRHARKTVQVIRDRGHTTGTRVNSQGQVCLIGGFERAVAPMGKGKAASLTMEFNLRFGEWMLERYPVAGEDLPVLSFPFADMEIKVAPATVWNDRILLTEDEACAWLGKFADDVDPQRP